MDIQYKKFQNNSIAKPYLPISTSKDYATTFPNTTETLSKLEDFAKNYTPMPSFSAENYSVKRISYGDSVYSSKQDSPIKYDPKPKEGPKYEPPAK